MTEQLKFVKDLEKEQISKKQDMKKEFGLIKNNVDDQKKEVNNDIKMIDTANKHSNEIEQIKRAN